MKYIFHFILIFLAIFAPKIPLLYNGTILAGILSLIVLITDQKARNKFLFLTRKKYVVYMISFPIVLTVLCIFITSIHSEYDFHILKTFINQSVSLFIIVLIVSVILSDEKLNEKYIHRLIFYVFVAQSLIMLTAFFNNSILSFIQFFQSEDIIAKSNSRGGIRTLMLATTAYFGLGITYGFVYIIYFRSLIEQGKTSIISILTLSILLLGTLFVARTGLIGFLIGVVLFFVSQLSLKRKIHFSINLLILSTISILILLVFAPRSMIESFSNTVIPFAFEMFIKDGLETNSTNHLLEMWNVKISIQTFFFGDGKYINLDGSYYKHTDVGYIRNILFGGVGFLLLLFAYQVFMIYVPLKKRIKKKGTILLFVVLLLFLLITHSKGEVLGFSKTLMITLFIYLLPIFYMSKRNENITDY